MTSQFYAVTAQKSTRVTGSCVGKFLGEDRTALVVSKGSRLEVFTLGEEGLVPVTECRLYGHVEASFLFRAPGEASDRLFVLTREHQVLALSVSREHVIEEVATGSIGDNVGERADVALAAYGDKLVGMVLYEGMLKCVPVDSKGLFMDAFNVRLPDRDIVSLCFLPGATVPTIVYLCEDGERRHLRSHAVNVKEKALVSDVAPLGGEVDKGASMVMPLGKAGVLIAGELEVMWASGKTRVATRFPGEQRARLTAATKIDKDGSRWLLGDESGRLWLLACAGAAQGTVTGLSLEELGTTVAASSLSYLDNGVVFVGSALGDSHVLRLLGERDPETGAQFEVLEVQANLAPIVDLACVDLEGQGQDQVVACCGAYKDGTLRVVRNGIGVNVEADLPLGGITGVWSMRSSSSALFDKYLCVSFSSHSVFLAMEEDDDLAELSECGGLKGDIRTLFCGTTVSDLLLQVHAGGVHLVQAGSLALTDKWQPPEGTQITVCCAAAGQGQLAVAVGGTTLVYLRVAGMKIKELGRTVLEHEIACMDMTPLVAGEDATLLAAGLWNEHSVRLLQLASLQTVLSEELGAGSVVPRSVRLSLLDDEPRLLVGLGDGRLLHYRLAGNKRVEDRKTVPLGTQAVLLTPFVSSNGTLSVFAGCDRPAVVYSGARKLLTSNVNQKNVSFVASFHTAQFPHCLAMATSEALIVGRLESLQKLHVDTVRMHEMVRRLAHHAPARAFAVGCMSGNAPGGRDSVGPSGSTVRLLDRVTMERLDSFQLERGEQVCAVLSAPLGAESDEPLVIVGTAFVNVGDPEPSQGRILVFVAQRSGKDEPSQQGVRLKLHCARTVNGAVYALASYPGGRLVAAVNARVELLAMEAAVEGPSLTMLADHFGHVLALHVKSKGDFILVGDLMRSMMVLRFDSVASKLVVVSRDYGPSWVTAVEFLGQDSYVAADQDGNVAVFCRSEDAEEAKLREVACYHVGENINCMRPGRLVQVDPLLLPHEVPPTPIIFAGTSGMIGILQPMSAADFAFFKKVEEALAAAPVWGLRHADWRAARVGRTVKKHEGFVDGDLVETLLDLHPPEQKRIAEVLDMSPLELVSRVEALARQCH